MGRLSNIKTSSSGNSIRIAQLVRAPQSFQSLCDSLTVRAYKELLRQKKHKTSWKEDTYTLNFKPIIEQFCFDDDVPIQVLYQEPQLTEDLFAGTMNPNSAKRMDLVFSQFAKPQNIKYGIEAKILTSINVGTRNAKRLCSEYVVSGMDRFLDGSYNVAGCMVGYVVSGNAKDTLKLINDNLCTNSRSSEVVKDQHTIESYQDCYQSRHKNCTLKHFIFIFT